ncbi:MAG: hypothetical protein FWC90_05465 [Oscillospiraceae bacterium]|nr:hypothetical protein [Oscillospiraceae bacterium]
MCINWDAVSAIATILAVIFGFAAIFISQSLQNKARIKHDVWIEKLDIFKTLSRHHGDMMNIFTETLSPKANEDVCSAQNLVPIIFRDSPEVLEKAYAYDGWVKVRENRNMADDIFEDAEKVQQEHNEKFQQLLDAMYKATKYS